MPARTARSRTRRVFDRDAYLGLRMPIDSRRRLEELARKKTRDLSSLALEFIQNGLTQAEQQIAVAAVTTLQRA